MLSAGAIKFREIVASDPNSSGWKLPQEESGHLWETERLYTVAGEKKLAVSTTRRKLVPYSGFRLRPPKEREALPGQAYLARFLTVLKHINESCPWCSSRFTVNDAMLCRMTATLLPYIVESPAVARQHNDRLRNLIRGDLRPSSNILWITNRQQGKTTSLSKLIAAIALCSPTGGNLVFLYSTSLDRAAEVMRAAKSILDWVIGSLSFEDLGFPQEPKVYLDNSREFTIISGYGSYNKVRARPKGVDQCRGDAPKICVVDEIAFVEQGWYMRFLVPLQAVSERKFLFATTPPLEGSWFQSVVELIKTANQKNDYHFEYITHTLACDACNAASVGDRCIHRLHFIPTWKSLAKMSALGRLVPNSERKAFNTEVLGMAETGASSYIHAAHLDALRAESRVPVGDVNTLFVSIDPASHRRSSMGLCATSFGKHGEYIVHGTASIECSRPELVQVQLVIKTFLERLRQVPELAMSTLIPIVECNGSEIYSASLVEVFQKYPPYENAFEQKRPGVAVGIGVITTHGSKIWSLTNLASALLKGSIRISPKLVTVCSNVYNSMQPKILPEEALELTFKQLSHFRDHPDGSVSGKGSAQEDDAGMALLLCTMWSTEIIYERKEKL